MAEPLSGTFRRPFDEQIAAFRLRLGNLVPTSAWDDLWQEQHDRAFMVAGATKADLLADLAAAVDKAVAQGTSLEEFRRDFRTIVERHGWHGWTGEGSKKGEAWRTRVIYRTNMSTSYMAGRYAQLTAANYRYWVYRHSGAEHPRLDHLSWDGIALPPDHPFWTQHYPPNGWGCGCKVYGARTEAGILRVGGTPGKDLPEGWDRVNPKTGAPVGIGRGWGYAPGASVTDTVQSLRGKLDQLPPLPATELIQSWLRLNAFPNWLNHPTGNWPLVRIPEEDAAAIGSTKTVADLSAETAAKQMREHPELDATDYAAAQRTVDEATIRLLEQDSRTGTRSIVYVHVVEDETAGGRVIVVKATLSGRGLFVTSLRRLSRDEAVRDAEVQRLIRKAGRRSSASGEERGE